MCIAKNVPNLENFNIRLLQNGNLIIGARIPEPEAMDEVAWLCCRCKTLNFKPDMMTSCRKCYNYPCELMPIE